MTAPRRNVFDLSHDVKLSCNMGRLIPTLALECVPGDKFNLGCDSLLRFAPLVAPPMHRADVSMHYFFVPNRLTWPGWEKYITNTPDPTVLPVPPFFQCGESDIYTELCDYMGIPAPIAAQDPEQISALPFAAYQLIYNEYYRDQNLITDIKDDITLLDGDNTALTELFILRKRAWEHDYFTSSLPFAQKGDPVNLPLVFNDVAVKNYSLTGDITLDGTPNDIVMQDGIPDPIIGPDALFPGDNYAETSKLSGETTINDLRRAIKLQEWLEKAARGGSRYVENILAHFGVRSRDSRLQRPEYITGTKSPVIISEVLNTTGTDDAPQGNMAGHAISVTQGKYGHYRCDEHGWIIGVMSVMPKPAYQNGIHRSFQKLTDPFEYFWPSFANIGEQEVKNKELYAFQGSGGEETFGYVPRYAEYKFMASRVAGDFRTTLDFWHMGRKFSSPPQLNQEFIEMDSSEVDRVFAVTDPDVQKLYVHILHKIRAVRLMPKFGTPQF